MELSLAMKFRIAAAAAFGVVVIGIYAWPLAAPAEPYGAVLEGSFSLGGKVILMLLAILTGFIAYFLSWPYGRQIAILAVPSGLALWALRSGDVAQVVMLNPAAQQRQLLYSTLKWEPLFWLGVVAAGFVGVIAAQIIAPAKAKPFVNDGTDSDKPYKPDIFITIFGTFLGPIIRQKFAQPSTGLLKGKSQKNRKESPSWFNMSFRTAIAPAVAVLIAQATIGIFARDVTMFDSRLGSVVAQPSVGQIVFAVLVSFALAGFLVKLFLNVGYIWPIIASALVTAFVSTCYIKQELLQHLCDNLPTVFFSHSAVCILPVQMVAFGTLGSIAGFWMAVRYNYWRKHEIRT